MSTTYHMNTNLRSLAVFIQGPDRSTLLDLVSVTYTLVL